MHVKRTQITYRERVGVYPGDSGSDCKHPYLQVSSGFVAAVIKFAFEVSLVSLPEINNNNNNNQSYLQLWFVQFQTWISGDKIKIIKV